MVEVRGVGMGRSRGGERERRSAGSGGGGSQMDSMMILMGLGTILVTGLTLAALRPLRTTNAFWI